MSERQVGPFIIRDNGGTHETGWSMAGHCHNFDHMTVIKQGKYLCKRWAVQVNNDGSHKTGPNGEDILIMLDELEVTGPYEFLIKASEYHSFKCLEGPGILECWYVPRDPNSGAPLQQWNGWRKAII